MPASLQGLAQLDTNGGQRTRVVRRVPGRATIQNIRSRAAFKGVVAIGAQKGIVALSGTQKIFRGVALQRVPARPGENSLDATKSVTIGTIHDR